MPKAKAHTVLEATHCNMCGSPSEALTTIGMRLNRSQGLNPRKKAGIAIGVCRCDECGLVFPQPMPKPQQLSDHYGMPAEHYWGEEYLNVDPNYFRRQIDDAKRMLSFKRGMTALDIGAGIGKAMIAMAAAGFDCRGLEPSAAFRDKAIELMNIKQDRLQLSSIETADFAPEQFDFITFGAVLEHFYDPATAIEKSLRWLKPSGVVQIEVPSSNHLIAAFLNIYFRLRGTNYVTNLSPMHSPFHLYEFTPRCFEKHGETAGYTIAHHHFDVCSIYHVPAFIKPALRKWMEMTNRGMQLTVWLKKY